MCGILALISGDVECDDVAVDLHEALYALQHRGQDACGIVTSHKSGKIYPWKGNGLASKVFRDGAKIPELHGFMGIGHLRYPTAGTSSEEESQPFYVSSPYGILFAHNGNLLETDKLKEYLDVEAHRHVNSESDSEIMLSVFASQLLQTNKRRVDGDDFLRVLKICMKMYEMTVGGFAFCGMVVGFAIFGARDPHGIRPLVIGSRPNSNGKGLNYMLASESVALDVLGFKNIVNIKPGQAVIIPKGRTPVFRQVHPQLSYTPDIFEYCYFARPDSVIDDISVHKSRQNMGRKLADTILKTLGHEVVDSIDVVIPIPDSGTAAAEAVAETLDLRCRQGFCKNRYIFRTFIMPNQEKRRRGVQSKLNALRPELEGKNVLLVDDSIVRGTTSRLVCDKAREAGAKKVYFACSSPHVTHPHIYGIDLATSTELVAYKRDRKGNAETMNADDVIYLTLEDLEAACAELSPRLNQCFEVGVFCGRYVTFVADGYLEKLEKTHVKPKAIEECHKAAFVPVGDRATPHPVVAECSDLSLDNLAGDLALL